MAGNAAHITSSLQSKPSIFEVIAQDSLCELLFPAFKIVVQFLGSNYPDRYQWLNKWHEEVFVALNGTLQYYYLNAKGASFSESFYGLTRVSTVRKSGRLSAGDKYWSLFCLVGLPYLVRKAERQVENAQDSKSRGVAAVTVASWRAACLVQYLRYLTGQADAHSPLLSVANLTLHYCFEEAKTPVSWAECLSSPKACARLVRNGLTQSLELGAFFLQALQWWHSDDTGHHRISNTVPPPPSASSVSILNPMNSAVCPVCKGQCRIETALLTSGYVFCYRCVHQAVSTQRKCPVTGLPTSLDELIRLYPTK